MPVCITVSKLIHHIPISETGKITGIANVAVILIFRVPDRLLPCFYIINSLSSILQKICHLTIGIDQVEQFHCLLRILAGAADSPGKFLNQRCSNSIWCHSNQYFIKTKILFSNQMKGSLRYTCPLQKHFTGIKH